MDFVIDILNKEIHCRTSVLKDKSWGNHKNGLDENHRTYRQILNSEIYYLKKAIKKLKQ